MYVNMFTYGERVYNIVLLITISPSLRSSSAFWKPVVSARDLDSLRGIVGNVGTCFRNLLALQGVLHRNPIAWGIQNQEFLVLLNESHELCRMETLLTLCHAVDVFLIARDLWVPELEVRNISMQLVMQVSSKCGLFGTSDLCARGHYVALSAV